MGTVASRRGGAAVLAVLAVLVSAALAVAGAPAAGGGPVPAQGDTSALPTPPAAERWSTDLAVSLLTDEVYVAFELNQGIERLRFDGRGGHLDSWRGPLLYPSYDVAVNASSGEGFEAMVRTQLEISHQSARGNLLHRWTTGFVGRATDLAVDDASNELTIGLLGSQLVEVHTFVQSGDNLTLRQVTTTDLADPTTAVGADTAGNVFAAGRAPSGSGTVQAFDDQGTKVTEWPVDGRPVGLVVGRDGPVVISQQGNGYRGAVHRFSPDGDAQGTWPVAGRPLDVEVGPDDHVYVTVQRNPGLDIAVEHYTSEGRLLLRWTALSRLFLPTVTRH